MALVQACVVAGIVANKIAGNIDLAISAARRVHLAAAQCAARGKQHDDAQGHLAKAGRIAARVGECNSMRIHFGPTNVAVWRLGVGVELGEGGRADEQATRTPLDMAALNSQERSSALFRSGPGAGAGWSAA